MILGSVQPAYLAWLPLFKRMQMSDVFVHLDDVEFSKNSPHNRNRIKTAQGPLFLTVPVNYSGHSKSFISEMPIAVNEKWAVKHLRAIEMNYGKAPFFKEIMPGLREIYNKPWPILGDLNITLIEYFKNYLGIKTTTYRSSELKVEGQGNEKLVNMCKKLGADRFVVKPGTEDYHPAEYFNTRGIGFAYFNYQIQPYSQQYGEFVPALSVLDYVMNVGPSGF